MKGGYAAWFVIEQAKRLRKLSDAGGSPRRLHPTVRGLRDPVGPFRPLADLLPRPDRSARESPSGVREDASAPPLVDGPPADSETVRDLIEADEVETMLRWTGG